MSKPISFPHRKNSGRIIVDQYDQIKKQREQDVICQFCHNQIPARLIRSHQNVCTIENQQNLLEDEGLYQNKSQFKHNEPEYGEEEGKNVREKGPCRLASQRFSRNSYSQLSKKKLKSNKHTQFQNGSSKNIGCKNLRESYRRPSSNKVEKKFDINKGFSNKKLLDSEKFEKKNKNNKSLISQAEKQYFDELNKKKRVSKMNKELKNNWVEQSYQNTHKCKEQEKKRQAEKIQRQRLKRIQNQTYKLKKQQERIIKQLQKQKKKQKRPIKRNQSQIKRQATNRQRQRTRNQPRPPTRTRNQPSRNARNHRRNEQRYPTMEESYYEEIPINHPHRALNFISQTINEQFEMMKSQFEHMNEFFSNFVPFSSNGFVYFERNQDSDYSIDSSGESLGYQQQQEQGLYEQQIQMLPKYTYTKRLGVDDQCAVCISSIRHNQQVRRLPCHHIFHSECIDQWLKRKAMCPVCRDQIGDLVQ